jgi:uncharacterized protein (TIGR03083 family)
VGRSLPRMSPPAPLARLAPSLVAGLFPPLGRELVGLLRSLEPAAWDRPTVCPAWSVRDIAAHLLDTAFRRLAVGRDGYSPPPPASPISDYGGLVRFLNRLNADWVEAARRLSPRLLTDLLEWVEPQLAEHFAAIDPWGAALFPVSWAGEDSSQVWFDVARELTERWHHQQQIRLAVGAQPLSDPETSEAIFDAFLRALPHRYREIAAPDGTSIVFAIRGTAIYRYTLRRESDAWHLLKGAEAKPAAAVDIAEQDAWLLLTKGMRGEEALRKAGIEGDAHLAQPFFDVIAVMA